MVIKSSILEDHTMDEQVQHHHAVHYLHLLQARSLDHHHRMSGMAEEDEALQHQIVVKTSEVHQEDRRAVAQAEV